MNAMRTRRSLLAFVAMGITTIVAAEAVARSSFDARGARRAVRPPPPPPPPPDALLFSLECTPSTGTITLAQRSSLQLWLVARNNGSTPIDTRRDTLEWFVNGQQSFELAMAFGNGVRTTQWSSLAPGTSVREARAGGDWLFPRRGRYVIAIRLNGREVARRVITVR